MYATGLRSILTGRDYPFDPTAYTDDKSGADNEYNDPDILDVVYDYEAVKADLNNSATLRRPNNDIFRYLPLLPVDEPGPVLPAGGTSLTNAPRLAKRLGMQAVYIKDETRNPTRCLKDRATAVGLTMALAQGYSDIYCASAGNAGISLAGFSAHAGLNCHVFVPSRVSQTRLTWLERFGANVHISTGNYDQAYDEAEAAGAKHGWYSRNCALNPFLVEGKKTIAFEISEQLGWDVPDYVISPCGDGCTLGAIGKGFREIGEVGLTDHTPHLIGVQSNAYQPMVRRFSAEPPLSGSRESQAASMAVHRPRNAVRLLNEVKASDGKMFAVSDGEIARAQRLLATEAGVVAEFTSAATLAGLFHLAEHQSLEDKTAVLVITGGRLDEE